MDNYTMENDQLIVQIKQFGAELKSVRDKVTGQEYMWEADPAFWGKTSPILFPFIGKLEGAAYRYQDKLYEIEKHGFARDMNFEVVTAESDRLVLAIESNKETLAKFPFPFRLEVVYELQGRSLTESIRVINKGGETMYFSVGGHPAFACPLQKSGEKRALRTACSVKLYGAEDKAFVTSTDIGVPDGLLTGGKTQIALEQGIFPVRSHIFDQDALCLEEQGVTAAALLDETGKEYVRMECDCPVWGIWSMPVDEASYVCLEPWWGICDSKEYAGTLQERPYTNAAAAGEIWEGSFRLIFAR